MAIHNVVPKNEANDWKQWLEEYVKENDVTGKVDATFCSHL